MRSLFLTLQRCRAISPARRLLSISAALLLMGNIAEARVTRIEVTRHEPFAGGQAFRNTGSYEKLVGRFYGELDPAAVLNNGIVDLDKAPRNAKGMVGYSSDFYILKPVDLSKGNGALLYDVNNRGNKVALFQFNSAPTGNDPSTAADAGNGFLMRYGFTVVWSGWLPDLPASNNYLRLDVPIAQNPNGPIVQNVWDEFLFNNKTTTEAKLSFPISRATPAYASLVVRESNTAPPKAVAPEQWEFVDAQTIRLLPAGTPFAMGTIYQLIYEAKNPPVAGIGLAATRDLIAFLRHSAADDVGNPNPLANNGTFPLTRVLAHGTSQSGRYLRDFVYRGFNEDETGQIVFDGINPHIAAGRSFLDFRFAQPERMQNIGYGFIWFPNISFPFAYETQQDPFTGLKDGILARCSERRNCPKVIHTVSAVEYWQSGESLVTTDPLGRHDGNPPDNVRIYHVASTQHVDSPIMPKGVCVEPWNTVDRRPVLRAMLLALDSWVRDGAEPPASRYPRIDDGSLVSMPDWHFQLAGVARPKSPNAKPRIDYGSNFQKGIIDRVPPEMLQEAYTVLIPQVDADDNEIGGIRLPEIEVPLATATGWALRAKDAGGAGELCYLDGSYIPFAKTKAERIANHDNRLSLEERYRDKVDYVSQIARSAEALEKSGYILPEDRQRIVEHADTLPW
jgi:alpha/beta hydrolase family protein